MREIGMFFYQQKMLGRRRYSLSLVLASCLLGMCGLLASCSSSVSTAPPEAVVYDDTVYSIGAGDQLRIDVWKSPELSTEVPVRPDGMITLPLVGDIQARGLTAEALGKSITTKLSDYIRTPQVTVIVANPASAEFELRVRVTGAVNQPTSIPYNKGMTVLDVVLAAGGTTIYAAQNNALLYRKNAEGIVTAYAVRLKDIFERGKLETNYAIQPSDIITVPERNF
jgi:polysaccharide export outer membrane protein